MLVHQRADHLRRFRHARMCPDDGKVSVDFIKIFNRLGGGMDVDRNVPLLGHDCDQFQQAFVGRLHRPDVKLANSLVRVFIQPVLNLVGHAAISSPVGRSPITKIGAQFWNDTIPRMFLEHDRAIVWGGGDKRDRNPVTVHHFQNRIGRMGISSGFLVMDMGVKDRQFRCFMLAIRPCEGRGGQAGGDRQCNDRSQPHQMPRIRANCSAW